MTVLTSELLAALEESATTVETAKTLPPVIYTSEEFLAFEKDALYAHEWLCLGRASRIPEPGDYFTVDVIGEPLVVARGKDGTIRVMSAVCQHRGMVVVEGEGKANTFKCPYLSLIHI